LSCLPTSYLIDQFLQTVSNKRTDSYGGSVENRCRFAFRAIEAVVSVYGQERTAIRFSPWGRFQDMLEDDPYETFLYVNKEVARRWPKLGYVHFVEPRNWTGLPVTNDPRQDIVESNDAFRAIYRGIDISSFESPSAYAKTEPTFPDPTPEHPTLFLSAAGHDAENVRAFVQRTGDVAAIGRYFSESCQACRFLGCPGATTINLDVVRLSIQFPTRTYRNVSSGD
jgi:2,4-dienoyl-CoA reductase-like NADH-dependent reductase (Old Yellow Enzyme family)